MTGAPFTITRLSPASPESVWAVLTDFAGYGSWIPLTRVRTDAGPPRVGWSYTGRSALGPVGFDDSMIVSLWEPPTAADGADGPGEGVRGGRFRIVKTGWLLDGWADVRVDPVEGGGAQVTWTERIALRPRPLALVGRRVVDRASEPMFTRALDAMLAEALRRETARR